MKRLIGFVLSAFVMGFWATTLHAQTWGLSEINRTIEQTNFVVNKGCSGTLISVKDRLILTANHCLGGQYEFIDRETVSDDGVVEKEKVRRLRDGTATQLSFQGAESISSVVYKVRVIAVDSNRDLALLQIVGPIPNIQAAQLACVDPVRGQPVYIVGNPLGVLYSSVVYGIVSSTQRTYDSIEFPREGDDSDKQVLIQISGGIIGGNSGGAVYNARGELIGVPVLANRINEVIGFAVPLSVVKDFLKEKNIDESLYVCRNPDGAAAGK